MVMKCFADPGSECSCPMADRTGKTMREVSVLVPLGAVCLPAKQGKQKLSIYSSCAHHQTSSRQRYTCHLKNHRVPVFEGQKNPTNDQPVIKHLGPGSIGMIDGR